MKEAKVKSYTRKTKSGKTVQVKGHSRKCKGGDCAKGNSGKFSHKQGVEFLNLMYSRTPDDRYMTKEESSAWLADKKKLKAMGYSYHNGDYVHKDGTKLVRGRNYKWRKARKSDE